MRLVLTLTVLALFVVLVAVTPVMAQPQPPCMYAMIDRDTFGVDDTIKVSMLPSFTANCGTIDVDAEGNFGHPVVIKFTSVTVPASVKEISARFPLGSDRRTKILDLPTEEFADGGYTMEVYVGGEVKPSTRIFVKVAKGGDSQVPFGFPVVGQPTPLNRANLPQWSTSPVSKISGTLYVRLRSEGVVQGFLYQVRSDRTVVLPVRFEPVPTRANAWYNWGSYGSMIDNPWMRSAVKIPNNGVFQDGVPVYMSLTTSDGISVQGVLYDGAGAVNFEGWNQ